MSNPKKWEDYTNGELVDILSHNYNWGLSKKIMSILKKRGGSLKDQYYGTYDRNATGRKDGLQEEIK